ncbi:hypothetical protein [Metabacillus sp. Hm71]|uniref:hypothetical protein n=1 Tax=Metabacillus sp. Hm71 TaxID=3450743 RepID=UPI003F427FBB
MDSIEKKMLLQMLVKRIDLDKIGDRPVVDSLTITNTRVLLVFFLLVPSSTKAALLEEGYF